MSMSRHYQALRFNLGPLSNLALCPSAPIKSPLRFDSLVQYLVTSLPPILVQPPRRRSRMNAPTMLHHIPHLPKHPPTPFTRINQARIPPPLLRQSVRMRHLPRRPTLITIVRKPAHAPRPPALLAVLARRRLVPSCGRPLDDDGEEVVGEFAVFFRSRAFVLSPVSAG